MLKKKKIKEHTSLVYLLLNTFINIVLLIENDIRINLNIYNNLLVFLKK